MTRNITGSRVAMVAAATAGAIVLTGAGVAAVPNSSAASGQQVKLCYSKKAADTKRGGSVLTYVTPGVNKLACKKGQKVLTLNIPGAQQVQTSSTSSTTEPQQSSSSGGLLTGAQGPMGPQGPAGPQGPQGPPGPALGGYLYRATTGTVASLINGRLRLPAVGPTVGWAVDETDSLFTVAQSGIYRISYNLDLGLALGFSEGSVKITRTAGDTTASVNGSDSDAESNSSFAGRDVLVKLNEGDVIAIQTKGLKIFGGALMIQRIASLDAS